MLGHLGALLGQFWGIFGLCWHISGVSWGYLGGATFWASWGYVRQHRAKIGQLGAKRRLVHAMAGLVHAMGE
eukprot:8311050-Karenia_brevis.AAC.1